MEIFMCEDIDDLIKLFDTFLNSSNESANLLNEVYIRFKRGMLLNGVDVAIKTT